MRKKIGNHNGVCRYVEHKPVLSGSKQISGRFPSCSIIDRPNGIMFLDKIGKFLPLCLESKEEKKALISYGDVNIPIKVI